ncbi:SagB/ThcOx family dehydrogenase [Methanoregula sp.]|jgi:SagB-type dehydrogenase family enzyme|uniref:SagB/ThcOx family dehydrogenase n=1 Tax=Methanoregula sp. TaxID=2052170 RepID=UPI003569684A
MNDVGKEFIKGTRYPDYSTVDLVLRKPEPPMELPVPDGAKITKLPDPKKIKVPNVPVTDLIGKWEPSGYLSRSSMTLAELSALLWYTQGFRARINEFLVLKNVPSSASRYPIETYFVAGEVEGLSTGMYRYVPSIHSIITINEDADISTAIATASLNFKVVTRAAVTFIWVGVPYRSTWAMGNRGYRSVLLEAGHTCQELIMTAGCFGFDVQPIDTFHDDMITHLTNTDPETQWPVYLAAVGKRTREV